MKRFMQTNRLSLILAATLIAGMAHAATPALRVNGVKYGAADTSVYVTAYGAKGDGTTDDSTAVQAAFTAAPSGSTVYFPAGNYKLSSTIVLPVSNVTIQGAGQGVTTITQGTANLNIFTSSSKNGITIRDFSFVGVAGTSTNSGNSILVNTSGNDITLTRCTITNFQHYALWNKGGARISMTDNTVVGGLAFFSQGGSNLLFARNIVRDPQFPNTAFVVPYQLDSTSGHAFGGATDITVIDNQFMNWTASQSILMHTGKRFVINNNNVFNTLNCISLSPFIVGDLVEDGTISGNTCIGAATSGVATSVANYGIFSGGLSGQTSKRINITSNYVYGFNAWGTQDTWGGIAVGWADDHLINGNILLNNVGNGVTLNNTNNRISVRGNHIAGTIDSTGLVKSCIGVWNSTSQTGLIDGNFCDVARHGIRLDVNTGGGIVVGQNIMTNIATGRIFTPSNGALGPVADTATFSAAPVFSAGATASGAVNFDLSGSTAKLVAPTGGIQMSSTSAIDLPGSGTLGVCTGNCNVLNAGNSAATTSILGSTVQLGIASTSQTFMRGSFACTNVAVAQSTAAMTLDAKAGCHATVTLTASVTTVTLNNFTAGQFYSITFVQGGAGSFTVTGWPATTKFLPSTYRGTTATAPTLSAVAGKRDTIYFKHDGTNLVQVGESIGN